MFVSIYNALYYFLLLLRGMDFNMNDFIAHILAEDVGEGDHSALSCIPEDAEGRARLLIKGDGILAGVELAENIFKHFDERLEVKVLIPDGSPVKYGDIGLTVHGPTRSILTSERIVLNCMQRMSGIATEAHTYSQKVAGTGAKVLDTRKTTPGLRYIEKWAVRIGGGHNHRMGLYDMIMIKDNHHDFCGGITAAVKQARKYLAEKNLDIKIEVETRNTEEIQEVLALGKMVDRVMFDNFTPEQTKAAVELVGGRIETESSGGITLETIRPYAEAGVDFISVGALTHSFKSMDISLKAF